MDGHYLLIDSTGNATEIIEEMKIGRGKASDLMLEDKLVSRHHATLWMDGDVLMIRDEESVNGTFVNHKQIYDETELKDQDSVQFGDEVFTVRAPLSESKTVKKVKEKVEEEVKEKAKDAAKEKFEEVAKEKVSGEEVPKKGVEPQKEAAAKVDSTAKKAAEPVEAASPKKSAEPAVSKSGEEELVEDELEAGVKTGGLEGRKLIIIGVILLVVGCCCIVVAGTVWFFFINRDGYDLIESGQKLLPLLRLGFESFPRAVL
jgi:pSer/pThr/pTyr-binding forkhead associated (FHA) protein